MLRKVLVALGCNVRILVRLHRYLQRKLPMCGSAVRWNGRVRDLPVELRGADNDYHDGRSDDDNHDRWSMHWRLLF